MIPHAYSSCRHRAKVWQGGHYIHVFMTVEMIAAEKGTSRIKRSLRVNFLQIMRIEKYNSPKIKWEL